MIEQLNHTAVVSAARAAQHARHHRLHDLSPKRDDFRSQVIQGLSQKRKTLPCKFFYDQRGSQLFDRICELPEYYLTRTELQILQSHVGEMADAVGPACRVVEYGSGSSLKTRLLLDALHNAAAYVPLDISREHLLDAAGRLSSSYPDLKVLPVCADYTRPFTLPEVSGARRTVVYFPGSTIGNFEPHDARTFLRSAARLCGEGGALLIGVDRKKDPGLLHAAYNDAAGVTAEFNLNLLHRINRELEGGIATDGFAHYAFYNPRLGRIEMHLLSRAAQAARIGGLHFHFREGETIFTESSYKYTLDEFHSLARAAGWTGRKVWTDPAGLFSVQYLTVS